SGTAVGAGAAGGGSATVGGGAGEGPQPRAARQTRRRGIRMIFTLEAEPRRPLSSVGPLTRVAAAILSQDWQLLGAARSFACITAPREVSDGLVFAAARDAHGSGVSVLARNQKQNGRDSGSHLYDIVPEVALKDLVGARRLLDHLPLRLGQEEPPRHLHVG